MAPTSAQDAKPSYRDLAPGLRRALWIGVAALTALGASIVAGVLFERSTSLWVQRSRDVRTAALTAELRATDAETKVRGFLLTGDSTNLPLALAAEHGLDSALTRLEAVTADNPGQRERAARVRTAVEAWLWNFANPATTTPRKPGAGSAVDTTIVHDAGAALFGRVRQATEAVLQGESVLYQQRLRNLEAARIGGVLLVVVELLLIGGIMLRLGRGLLTQAAVLGAQQEALEDQAAQLETQAMELEQQAEELEAANEELVGALRDAEQARATAERSLAFLNAALASAPVGIAFYDRDRRYVIANARLAAFHGRAPEELVGRTTDEVSPAISTTVRPLLDRVIEERQPVMNLEFSTPTPAHPDGVGHWLASYYPIVMPSGEVFGVGAAVLDITERKRLEDDLVQARKMEAVGRLAGGIAHDFNNVLTVIGAYTSLLQEAALADGDRRNLEEIRAATDRAADLTRQLLAFSRKQVMQLRVISVTDVIDGMRAMLRRLLAEDIELEVELDADVVPAMADPGQVAQIIMNLAINAADAMPRGGRLGVVTRTARIGADGAITDTGEHGVVPAGTYAEIVVRDTGTGIAPEVLPRIFDPFFTTKAPGHGTGLGLATVYGIVKQSGGYVTVRSEVGRGTAFHVFLPQAGDVAQAAGDSAMALPEPMAAVAPRRSTPVGSSRAAESRAPAVTARQTILVVEDEDSIRQAMERALTRAGFSVLSAPDGPAALALAAAHAGEIHLTVSDLMMPGMSGRQLAERITVARSGMRVLFVSGFTDDDMIRRGMLAPNHAFLQKPFTLSALLSAVRSALEGGEYSRA
ncbi:MAG TPA: ATP-binding protein [Gemmatimonadaceae bacterium]|nr:ATP-binding protein [Gemmatimonadaceae bacterium]